MDLIEVLWKQDIDMGVSRDMYDGTWKLKEAPVKREEKSDNQSTSSSSFHNPWHGLNYSIDSETGEHIILPANDNAAAALVPNSYSDITLEEALSLFDSDDFKDITPSDLLPAEEFTSTKASDVLQPEAFPHDPEFPYTSRINQSQALIQQLDDFHEIVPEVHPDFFPDSTRTLPYSYENSSLNYDVTENDETLLDVLLQNTTLALPMNESLLNSTYPSDEDFKIEPEGSFNSLLSFLTNDSDPNPVGAVGGQDQNNLCPDIPIANLTVDNTFLSQLMREGTMDFSDFCDGPANKSPHDSWFSPMSSDSALSSIGSDWSDSCSSETNGTGMWPSGGTVADKENWNLQKPQLPSPKKYQLFGKQKRPNSKQEDETEHPPKEDKSVSLSSSPDEGYEELQSTEPVNHVSRLALTHNHTYHHAGDAVPDDRASQKPLERDKPKRNPESSARHTRDEKRLSKSNVPLSVKEIVELSIEHFNERLAQLNLSEEDATLVRDIRRRGKNKLAARSCRKRKVDQIVDLQDNLDDLHRQRQLAYSEMEGAITRRDMLRQKYQRLYQFIFPDRDPPDPVPTSLYFQEALAIPPNFPTSSNGTTVSDAEHKKRGKHKGVNNK